jgi:hypothetical protein
LIEEKKDQTEYKTTLDKKLEHWHKTTKSIETANADAKTGIDKMLTEGEQILIYADQSRMMAGGSIATPNSIYVTNKRNTIWKKMQVLSIGLIYYTKFRYVYCLYFSIPKHVFLYPRPCRIEYISS